MAGAQAHTVSPLQRSSGGAAAAGNVAAAGLAAAARRSQFGGVNMLAGFSNNPLLNGVSNPGGLTGATDSANCKASA